MPFHEPGDLCSFSSSLCLLQSTYPALPPWRCIMDYSARGVFSVSQLMLFYCVHWSKSGTPGILHRVRSYSFSLLKWLLQYFKPKKTPPEGTKGAQIVTVFTKAEFQLNHYCTQSKEGTWVLLAEGLQNYSLNWSEALPATQCSKLILQGFPKRACSLIKAREESKTLLSVDLFSSNVFFLIIEGLGKLHVLINMYIHTWKNQ